MADTSPAPQMQTPRRRLPAFARCLIALVAVMMLLAGADALRAAAELPALTGRVVDDANLLSATSQSVIESKLRSLEEKSGIQFVVATVKSLGGEEIEPYANRLFRTWKLGEKTKNNGVLLLVAPAEHKARIEVGYGLEGTLTDALSKLIITNALVPRFKANDFQGGIERGVDDVISVLSTDAAEWQKRPDLQKAKQEDSGLGGLWPFIVVFGIVLVVIYVQRRSRYGGGRNGGMVFIPMGRWGSDGGGSSGGGSSGDSGFSGGGGSSGGGGASGDW